uniref:Zinc finger protein 541 n=1 Tax=Aceria tosichella TaxID=561515 RepID=A0A6G1SLK5_9ACAR
MSTDQEEQQEQQQPQHDDDDSMLIWAPDVIENVSSLELDLYLKFASTACIPGGGCNVEEALDVLYKCHGDIKEATKKLLMRETKEVAIWTLEEVQMFEHLFRKRPKDFISISKDLKTKSLKNCVEFYYLWKQQQHQLQPQPQYHYLQQHQPANISQLKHEQQELLDHHQQQLQQHHEQQQPQILIFQQQQFQQLPNVIIQPQQEQPLPQVPLKPGEEQFPCKVCGRIFLKIKSRSAHMKRHKNERLYNIT